MTPLTPNPLTSLIFSPLEPDELDQVQAVTDLKSEEIYDAPQMSLVFYHSVVVRTLYRQFQQSESGDNPVESSVLVNPADVAAALVGLNRGQSGLLPPYCLGYGYHGSQTTITAYLPPQPRRLVWKSGRRKKDALVPLPGLIFKGRGRNFWLWAVKESYPLADHTPLYHAPLPNVHGDGRVCLGDVDFPDMSVNTFGRCVTAFFESRFNRDLSNGKSEQQPQNILKLWTELDGEESYPLDDLRPSNLRLKEVLND